MEGERALVLAEFRDLDDKRPDEPGPDREIHRSHGHDPRQTNRRPSWTRACGDGWTPGSRTRRWWPRPAVACRAAACPKIGCERFPAEQVILLDERREYEVRRDDVMKMMTHALLAGRGPGSPDAQVEAAAGPLRRCPGAATKAVRRPGGGWTSGSPCCGTSRPCGSTPPSTAASCPPSWPRSPCRCPTIRSPASRSAMSGSGPRRISAAVRPRATEKDPAFNIHYELTVRK